MTNWNHVAVATAELEAVVATRGAAVPEELQMACSAAAYAEVGEPGMPAHFRRDWPMARRATLALLPGDAEIAAQCRRVGRVLRGAEAV